MMHGNDIHNISHGAFQDLMSLQVRYMYICTVVSLVDLVLCIYRAKICVFVHATFHRKYSVISLTVIMKIYPNINMLMEKQLKKCFPTGAEDEL